MNRHRTSSRSGAGSGSISCRDARAPSEYSVTIPPRSGWRRRCITTAPIFAASGEDGATLIYDQLGEIHLYDTATGQSHQVSIQIDADLPEVRRHIRNVAGEIDHAAIFTRPVSVPRWRDLKLLAQPKTFAAWLRPLYRQDWVVYLKRPFGGPEYVLQYLGRYTHRVAISNHRLVSFADGQVTFRWRDSADHKPTEVAVPLGSMNSCAASYCTSFRKVLCASVTSAFWPTANAPRSCRSAFSCWAQPKSRKLDNTLLPLKTRLVFGAALNAVERLKVIERLSAAEIQLRSPPQISAVA